MTPEQIRSIADEAAEKAVTKTLVALGIPANDPLKAQAIFLHIERQYDSCQTIKQHSLKMLVGAFGTVLVALGGYVLLAFRSSTGH